MSDSIEIIYHELYNYNNSNSEKYLQKILEYSISGSFHKINIKNNGSVSLSIDYNSRNYGCNFYTVIFPHEGIVLMLTLEQISAISGLHLWIDYESCIQFPMFRLDIYEIDNDVYRQFQSPNIIICSLPLESLVYNYRYSDINNENSNCEINVNMKSILRN